ncbi:MULTISPECIES: hypothetical protein [Methanobacterium]|uniref:Uncharacterized protein n=1 Tax=Methanobacterium veterum TaxID=408577 RepID=A0A9E5A584_9EURY|nr:MULTISPECIES: hypothetical protein [Methanobacterium]MCZ3372582.1 hypothetical protein [Methanobacterium veterum]
MKNRRFFKASGNSFPRPQKQSFCRHQKAMLFESIRKNVACKNRRFLLCQIEAGEKCCAFF